MGGEFGSGWLNPQDRDDNPMPPDALQADTMPCQFRPFAAFRPRVIPRIVHPPMYNFGGGSPFCPPQTFYPTTFGHQQVIDRARQLPQLNNQFLQRLLTLLERLIRRLEGGGGGPSPVVARPDVQLGHGLTQHGYSNGDFYITDANANNRITSARIGNTTYRAVPNRPGYWLIGPTPQGATPGPVEGHFEHTPQGMRFIRDHSAQPLANDGPVRTNLPDNAYRLTYGDGSFLVYNRSDEVTSARIAGINYTRLAPGLYRLTHTSGAALGTSRGHFDSTQRPIRFVAEETPDQLPPNVV